jgi:hypothetical protein
MGNSAVAAASDEDGIYRADPPTSLKASQEGSLRAVCNHINFIVPGARWCDHAEDALPTKKVADL